jgi:predicted GNAT family acetyltransferase
MNDLQKEIMRVLDLHELGKPIYANPGKDGISRADFVRSEPEPLRAPLRQAEPQSLEKTMQDIPAVAGGIAGGVGVGLGEAADLGIGLLEGAYKAINPNAEEGRFQSFVSGLAEQFETGYGEQARSVVMDMGKRAGFSPEQLDVMDESITAGSMLSIGGAAKKAAQAVPGVMSKAGDVIEGAGEGAKARMAEGGVTLGAGVDPDPLIAAAGDAIKAMRGGVSEIKITKTTDASDTFGQGAKSVTYTDPQSGGFIEVVQRKDGPTSVLRLEVPEQFRGSGIGQKLQAAAMADNPELQGQVSSKAAAVGAYRLGRRPVSNPDATLNEVFDIIDEQSSVLMKMPRQPGEAVAAAGDAVAKFRAPTEKEPGIIAFHGSGADFDEFKLEKIGTGEGAQAYGYGLYFTDSEDIAKFYRDSIGRGRSSIVYDGDAVRSARQADGLTDREMILDTIAGEMAFFDQKPENVIARKIKNLKQKIDDPVDISAYGDDAEAQELKDAIIASSKRELEIYESIDPDKFGRGKMYKVGLEPKPEDMLDYSKSITEQSKKVQDALYSNDEIASIIKRKQKEDGLAPEFYTGEELYGDLVENLQSPQAASNELVDAGIFGLKYKAAGSRGASVDAADVEMNYVIFDDKMIKILEKYGIVGPVAITGIAASQQEGESDGRSA